MTDTLTSLAPKISKMEDPDLIATLIPTDPTKFAENAFLLPHNCTRYLAPTMGIGERPTISSREPTPTLDESNEDGCEYDSTHCIQLRFGDKPIDPASGYAFGTDPKRCDVLLSYRGVVKGISGHHFNITFDEQGHLILKDLSTHGTAVSYDGQARDEVQRRFTWRLDLEMEWDVEVHVPNKSGLAFKVKLASHHTCQAEYHARINKFLADSRTALPRFNRLGIDSYESTAPRSETLSSREGPVYI